MQINELAKKCGCSVQSIVDFLSGLGMDANSISGDLSPEVAALVLDKFEKKYSAEGHTVYLKPIKLGDLSDKIEIPSSHLIMFLLRSGYVVSKNQFLQNDTLRVLADEFGFDLVKEEKRDISVEDGGKKFSELSHRPPVIVVVGHVDHGKTTLLDYIRKTRVASREHGGITQHLGAYRVDTNHGSLVFLDTPGHEAFSMMRRRGMGVADIAILIVAADDGVMPQTEESIKQANEANIPIVVAVNKVDKVDSARIDAIKQQLSQRGVLVEDWGGQVVMVPISAKTGQGVDVLLEMVALQSEMLELKADSMATSEGFILDSHMQKGLGATATFLARHGTIRIGDHFVVGDTGGRIMSIVDSDGKKLKEASPAIPVKISGFDSLPKVGEYLKVVPFSEYKKIKSGKVAAESSVSVKSDEEASLNLILKADTESSSEAIIHSISKQSGSKGINIVSSGVGNINESDIVMAEATGSSIYGFNVKVESKALVLAQKKSINLNLFNIIYKLLEFLEESTRKNIKQEISREKTGEAEVKKVFAIKKLGTIAGFQVKQGKIFKKGEVEAWRDGYKIGEGKIQSLQKDKKSMKEIGVGFEGAMLVDGFDEWQDGDKIIAFVESSQL
jgi:translation initiation factor IF-2